MSSALNEKEIIGLTQRLVSCPSVNPPGDSKPCAGILLDYFRRNSIEARLEEAGQGVCNLVARLSGRGKGKTLVLNGHLDVVPPGEGWTVDPFGAEIKDGILYGRGASDMKSGLAALAAAVAAFKRSGAKFNGEIIFMAAGDEETGSRWGTVHLLEQGIGRRADFAIVAEPTDLAIHLGNRGLRWVDLTVKGKACHAGYPHLGINPIAYAAKLIELIESHKFTTKNDLFEVPFPSASVTMIEAGTKINVIPPQCRLSIDRRMLPGETAETVKAELAEMIGQVLRLNPELSIDFSLKPEYWDPYLISPEEPVVLALRDAFKKVTGAEPGTGVAGFCTDGSDLYHLGGVPAALFGPGNQKLAHQADECVPLANIVTAARTVLAAFPRLLPAD